MNDNFGKWLKENSHSAFGIYHAYFNTPETKERRLIKTISLLNLAKLNEKKFRMLSQKCFELGKFNKKVHNKKILFEQEQYFDGLADAWKEILEGNCEQLERKIKGVESKLKESFEK